MIATKLMLDQGIDVKPIIFASPFFHHELAEQKTLDFMGLKAKVVVMDEKYLDIVKNPEYGYGAGINPCIDCKIYMFKIAAGIMEQENASFIFSGEVLNQRPFSQTRNLLQLIEKRSDLSGLILRPLSAKLLPPTEPELAGLVNRKKLLGISGRSRKEQLEIAQNFNISGYSQPAGGCLLTDRIFAARLKELFRRWPECKMEDVKILKYGRIFWCRNCLIVVGRNEKDNESLLKRKKKEDSVLEVYNVAGPVVLVRGKTQDIEVLEYAKDLLIRYTPKACGKKVKIRIKKI